MYSQKDLEGDLEAVSAIKAITTVYQEIASFRMNQLRGRVRKTREFLEGVSTVYNHAKTAYIASFRRQSPKRQKKIWESLAFVRRNGKKINVFLSANEHLYGTLILDVWGHYVNDLREGEARLPGGQAEAAVIGSIGKYLLNNEKIDVKTAFFELSDDKPEATQIKKITQHISQYEQVVIYHGQMVTVLHQIPVKSEISGGVSFQQKIGRGAKSFLFEPSPEKILAFFETEIIAALFNQTVLEHQLARFAARMVAMDQATENANEREMKIEKQIKDLHRRIANRKQLEVFAGFGLWGKEDRL